MSRLASHMLSFARLSVYFLATLALIPVQMALLAVGGRAVEDFPRLYHSWMLRLLGFKLQVYGTPSTERPTLFVSNHGSYIDIEILGSIIAGSFVAKNEVKGWPVFGVLARLQRSVFVDRRARTAAGQRDSLSKRLTERGNVILFPEGTTNDGNRLRPFKSALLSAAATVVDGRTVAVQPVTVAYTRLNGMPIGRELRPFFAWYGDMTLGGHLWTMVGLGLADVVVQFHPPVRLDLFGSRKALTEHCQRVIAEGLSAANAGRLKPVETVQPAPSAMPAAGGTAVIAS